VSLARRKEVKEGEVNNVRQRLLIVAFVLVSLSLSLSLPATPSNDFASLDNKNEKETERRTVIWLCIICKFVYRFLPFGDDFRRQGMM